MEDIVASRYDIYARSQVHSFIAILQVQLTPIEAYIEWLIHAHLSKETSKFVLLKLRKLPANEYDAFVCTTITIMTPLSLKLRLRYR